MVVDESVARVRDSVARTLAEGGALIRYQPRVMTIDPAEIERRLRERGNRFASLVAKAVGGAGVSGPRGLDGPDGRIDFATGRSTYFAGCWKVFADAWMYDGEPGEWEAEPRTALVEDDPLWLLALTQATIQAVEESADVIAGVVCERYRCVADLELKPAVGGLTVQAPNWGAGSEPSRLPILVWLDDEGRIRRASYNGENNLTELELRDFGPQDEVTIPGLEEIHEVHDADE
jgi:hypothetical protein